jgi:hypothetical protein
VINKNGLYQTLGTCHPALVRGLVRCGTCGREKKVDSGECIRTGWPKCCNYTMTLVTDPSTPTPRTGA